MSQVMEPSASRLNAGRISSRTVIAGMRKLFRGLFFELFDGREKTTDYSLCIWMMYMYEEFLVRRLLRVVFDRIN